MKTINFILKLIQVLSLLSIPPLISYWLLLQIDLVVLAPLKAIFGMLYDPFISTIKSFGNFETIYNDIKIDFSGLILVVIFIAIYFVFNLIEKLVTNLNEKIEITKINNQIKNEELKKEQEKIEQLRMLQMNKIIHMALKFRKQESSLSYLCNLDQGTQMQSESDKVISNILNYANKFDCKKQTNFEEDSNTHIYTFNSLDEAIDFAFYINNTIASITNELMGMGEKLTYSIVLHCSIPASSQNKNIILLNKVLGLTGSNQIFTTEIFKNKYFASKENSNLKFKTKGIYNIQDNRIEIFNLKA